MTTKWRSQLPDVLLCGIHEKEVNCVYVYSAYVASTHVNTPQHCMYILYIQSLQESTT